MHQHTMQQISKQGPADGQMQPTSGQRSMKNIIKMQKQAVPQQNLMLIYEENTKDQIILFNQTNSRANNKIVNVSFNDFSQSVDNPNVENSIELENEPSEVQNKRINNINQIQTSNKNLNNFLEALQKIKP